MSALQLRDNPNSSETASFYSGASEKFAWTGRFTPAALLFLEGLFLIFFFSSSGVWVKMKLKPSTLPRTTSTPSDRADPSSCRETSCMYAYQLCGHLTTRKESIYINFLIYICVWYEWYCIICVPTLFLFLSMLIICSFCSYTTTPSTPSPVSMPILDPLYEVYHMCEREMPVLWSQKPRRRDR